MKHKFSLILISVLLSTTFAWSANVIKPGTYSGKWTQHSIGQLDGKVRTATSVIVSDEVEGKQTITFKGYKVGYTGDVATDIEIEVLTSNGSCTIAKDTKTGHVNTTYGDMYIRTYANYTSSVNPQSMIITFCAHYYYIKDSKEVVLQGYDNNYEYIQLNPDEWTEWTDFPETGKNTAKWTFNENNAFASLIDESCTVTLQSRENVANSLLKQILVKGFKMNATSPNCIATDLVLNWDTETNEITMAYSGLGFYESTAKQARGKITSTGEFDFATGKFTLPMEYVYANAWKGAVQETLMLSDIVPLKSIYITPKYLLEGNSVTYTAKLTPANATFSNLIWTINNTEVATISRNTTDPLKATVTKVNEGSATITATLGSVSETAEIYVGKYSDWKDYQIDGHTARGVYNLTTLYTNPIQITNQHVQVSTFSSDEHFKKFRILNFGAGKLSNDGVKLEMKWDGYDNLITIAKQETGKTKTTEDYTSPIYIADNSYFIGGVNTSSFDEEEHLFTITPVYFYYKSEGAGATAFTPKTETLQLSPINVSRSNTDSHKKYIVPVAGGTAYFEGTEGDKKTQMMFKLEGTELNTDDWQVTPPSWVTTEGVKKYTDYIGIEFQVKGYTLTPREETINVEVYGYTFKMPISQAAPTLKPRTGMENTKKFTFLGTGDDDALRIDGNKTEKIYLDSEVDLSDDNITVESQNGLTKIVKAYESTSIGLTLTRDHLIAEEAKDIVTVSFKGNSDIKYEYTITQAPMPSAFYNLPDGAFVQGMNNKGALTYGAIYLPYSTEPYVFSSVDGAGDWWSNGSQQTTGKESYSYSNLSMKAKKTIPQLRQEGKVNYQYGGSGVDYDKDHLFFYVGNSDMQYMTPAKLWCDLTQKANGQAQTLVNTFYTKNYDVMGVYFDNKDVMYIDGISIPISADLTEKTITQMLPTDKHVTVKIYHATINDEGKSFDRNSEPIWKGNLKQNAFTPYDNTHTYRGALNATFEEPISINGPFVVELSDMSGCEFYVYSAKERPGCNKWGYYLKGGQETYPGDYTLAVSVHAMFPALYPNDDADLSIEIPAEGGPIERTVFANCKYVEGSDWNLSVPEGIGLSVVPVSKDEDETTLSFTMTANTTTAVREGDVTFTFRGKTLTYHVTQPAPELTTYTRDNLTFGKWGTICLPYAAKSFTGAEMYSIAGKMEDDKGIYLDQVNEMEAGKPYIFKATAEEIKVVYAAGEAQEAQTVNGLCGYIGKEDLTVPTGDDNDDNYIVYNNALYLVDSEGVTIASNRAYIKYSGVGTPSSAPQIRRVAMPINNAPTSMLQVNDTKQPVKILRDGHIVILRADKEYDILGQSK